MGGAFKSGLLFGAIGVLVVAGLTFVFLVCGPVGAVVIGAVAGYFGVRWSGPLAGVGAGVLASAIAGVLMLLAALIMFIISFNTIKNDPQFQQVLQEALAQQQQQQGATLNADQQQFVINAIAPVGGFCFGLINLVAALIFGALGGWLAVRNRAPTMQPPPPPAPLGPPPLSPM